MTFSTSNPKNPNPVNPGVSGPTRLGTLLPVGNQVSQIRGIATNGSLGAGIPNQVANVTANVSHASSGTTSTVSVIFNRDPSDANFSVAKVYIRGYQGNPSWVQTGASDTSPITFVLNNSGEAVSIAVQASGNSGDAPLTSSPTTGIRLPQSTAGGFGTSTSTSSGPTQLTGDVTTTGTASPLTATVVGLRTISIDAQSPVSGDTLRYDPFGGVKWIAATPTNRVSTYFADGENSVLQVVGAGTGTQTVGASGVTAAGGIAGEAASVTFTGSGGASVNTDASWKAGLNATTTTNTNFTLASVRRFLIRQRSNAQTNRRFWVGVTTSTATLNATLFATNTPNTGYVAFRYSSSTDSTWKAVTGTATASQTVVDTGIAYNSTTGTVFEIIPNTAGTSVTFRINGVTGATIATNLFGANTGCVLFSTGDNKNNAANTPIIDWMYSLAEFK